MSILLSKTAPVRSQVPLNGSRAPLFWQALQLVPFDQVKIKEALQEHCNLTTNLIAVRRTLFVDCI